MARQIWRFQCDPVMDGGAVVTLFAGTAEKAGIRHETDEPMEVDLAEVSKPADLLNLGKMAALAEKRRKRLDAEAKAAAAKAAKRKG
jgi:hypothetical protein